MPSNLRSTYLMLTAMIAFGVSVSDAAAVPITTTVVGEGAPRSEICPASSARSSESNRILVPPFLVSLRDRRNRSRSHYKDDQEGLACTDAAAALSAVALGGGCISLRRPSSP